MVIELIPLDELKEDDKRYRKALGLVSTVKLDYDTGKHLSFSVAGEESDHNVMYFAEKTGGRRWQCDCKWYTLQNKICSHMIAVNLAVKRKQINGLD